MSDELLDEVDNLIDDKIIGEEISSIEESDLENTDLDLPEEQFTLKKTSWTKRITTAVGSVFLLLISFSLVGVLTYQLWLKQALPDALISPVTAIVPLIDPVIKDVSARYDITLPVRRDLNNIQLVSANTEAHPSRASTILLRVSFLNRAKIEQPLPDLELSLTDEDGRIVSRRSFLPKDYLYNNATKNIISSNELKKVTIELLAFPKHAHGYELKIID